MKAKVLALLIQASFGTQAADCTNAGIQPSTDEAVEFVIGNDGTVTDKTTGLMWMRCVVGQNFVPATNSCTGTAIKAEWDKMVLLRDFNASGGFAGKTDWRLPNVNELRSIVEDCRAEPAINTVLFPDTPAGKFWTSTTYITAPANAWQVDFGQGRDNYDAKTNVNYIRLVRVAK